VAGRAAPEQKAAAISVARGGTFRDIRWRSRPRWWRRWRRAVAAPRATSKGLFDLELDTEKNQYESKPYDAIRRSAAARRRRGAAETRAARPAAAGTGATAAPATTDPRNSGWQQEMLRREAEELQRQMEQLSRGDNGQLSRNGQQGQQGQQGQSGPKGQQGQQGQQGHKASRGSNQTARAGPARSNWADPRPVCSKPWTIAPGGVLAAGGTPTGRG